MWRFKISLMRIFLKGFVDFFIAVKFPTLSDFLLMLNVYRVNEVDSLPLISMAIDSGLSLCNILLVNIGAPTYYLILNPMQLHWICCIGSGCL